MIHFHGYLQVFAQIQGKPRRIYILVERNVNITITFTKTSMLERLPGISNTCTSFIMISQMILSSYWVIETVGMRINTVLSPAGSITNDTLVSWNLNHKPCICLLYMVGRDFNPKGWNTISRAVYRAINCSDEFSCRSNGCPPGKGVLTYCS
jgi:hypothetical protein